MKSKKNSQDTISSDQSARKKLKTTTNDEISDHLYKNSGFITCSICDQTKWYSHVQRRYGIFSCETCFKFFSRFIKDPKYLECNGNGQCLIVLRHNDAAAVDAEMIENHDGDIPTNDGTGSRCKACWLKLCIDKFKIDDDVRESLIRNYYPPKIVLRNQEKNQTTLLESAPIECSKSKGLRKNLKISSKLERSQKHQNQLSFDGEMSGPATSTSTGSHSNESIRIDPDSPKISLGCQHTAISNNMEMTTSTMINEDLIYDCTVGPRINYVDNPDPSSVVNPANYSNFDFITNNRDSLFDQQSTSSNSPRIGVSSTNSSKKSRCKECDGCRAQDCGQCSNCLDKKKFGGSNVIKQACKYRVCLKFRGPTKHNLKKRDPQFPANSPIVLPSFQNDSSESIDDRRQKSSGSIPPSPSSLSICDKQYCDFIKSDDNYSLPSANYYASQPSSLSLTSPIISPQSLSNQHYLSSTDYDYYRSPIYPDYYYHNHDFSTDFCMHCHSFRVQNQIKSHNQCPILSYHQNYEYDPDPKTYSTDIPNSAFWIYSQPQHSIHYNDQPYYKEFDA